MTYGPNGIRFARTTLSSFAHSLMPQLGAPVIDNTGLPGLYTFTFQPPAQNESAPSLFTVLQEQLGLKLESRKVAVETIVIDSADGSATR